jgi:hypothetical protein
MMSTFEYISVLLSIVVGLGLARLLTGVGQALEARRRIRFYWVQAVWVVNLVLLLVSFWWATLYGHSDRQAWLFPNFAVLLVYSILLFLGTVLIIPSDLKKSNDLEVHFFEVRPWFFGISALIPVMELADTLLHGGIERVLGFGPYFILLLGGSFVMCIIGAVTASRTFHAIWAIVFLLAMTGWEVLGFWSIG